MTMSDRIAVMNRGRYEQLGEPEVLYERPTTRFVAGFLGVSNLLPATPDGTADGYAVFRLEDGTAVRAPGSLLEGKTGRVSIGVRPEKIRLHELRQEEYVSTNRLDGTIRHASYLGVSTQYIVELRGGRRISVYEQNVARATRAELWAAGEEVRLTWSPDHSFIVAEDQTAAASDETEPEPVTA